MNWQAPGIDMLGVLRVAPAATRQTLKDPAWRARVGFDNYYKAIWKKPVLGLYYSRRRKKA